MNESISTSSSSVEAILSGQLIIFIVIIGVSLVCCICCCFCNLWVRDNEEDEFYLASIKVIITFNIFLGILIGPLISVFTVSSKSDFTEGCYTFALAHLFTNVSYPVVFLLAVKINYFIEKNWIYKNYKSPSFRFSRIGEDLLTYSSFICGIIFYFMLTFGNLAFYFSQNFISVCNDENLEKENTIYIFSLLLSYISLNFHIAERNIRIYEEQYKRFEIFIKNVGLWILTYNLMILYLRQKVEDNSIKREAFFTSILYFYFTFPIVFLVMLLYFIFDKIFIIFGEDHVPSYTINRNRTTHLNSPNEKSLFFKTDTNEWKYDEKNEKLKSHILEDTK